MESRLFLVGFCVCVYCVYKRLFIFVYVSGQTRLCTCEIRWTLKLKQSSASFHFKHHHWLCQMAYDARFFQSYHWLISDWECVHSHTFTSLLLRLCISPLTPLSSTCCCWPVLPLLVCSYGFAFSNRCEKWKSRELKACCMCVCVHVCW